MTLQQVYQTIYNQIPPNARTENDRAFDLSCLFEHALGISRYRLPLVGDQTADPAQVELFFALAQRYQAGEPLQYLLGTWEFYGLPFAVGEGVLIPRPDTETLVETALSLLKERTNPVLADLCAGSGCIAITLSHLRPDAHVYALELSDQAFPYLTKNIEKNGVKVDALRWDVRMPPTLPPLDLVVSNPPYISRQDMGTLQKQVTFEPELALFGGEDGYDFYRTLPTLYRPLLKPGGWIAFEVGYDQSEQVAELLADAGYRDILIRNDLGGVPRVVAGVTGDAEDAKK